MQPQRPRPYRPAKDAARVKIGRIAKPSRVTPTAAPQYYWVTGSYVIRDVAGVIQASVSAGCAIVCYNGQTLSHGLFDAVLRNYKDVTPTAECMTIFAAEIQVADFERLARFDSYDLMADDTSNSKTFVLPLVNEQ